MPKKSTKQKRVMPILSYADRERLRKKVKDDEEYLGGLNQSGGRGIDAEMGVAHSDLRGVDRGAIEARIRRNKAALDRLSPGNQSLSTAQKNRINREMKADEKFFKAHMLSLSDMGYFPNRTGGNSAEADYNYRMACDKSFEQEVGNPEFTRRAERYKRNAMLLDPDNTDLTNLERFRPRGDLKDQGRRRAKRY